LPKNEPKQTQFITAKPQAKTERTQSNPIFWLFVAVHFTFVYAVRGLSAEALAKADTRDAVRISSVELDSLEYTIDGYGKIFAE